MRGFWYMVEAVLAGIIIVTFLIIVAGGVFSAPGPGDLSLKAYSILHDLDRQELLRDYVMSGDYAGLNSQIYFFGYNHSIEICSPAGSCIGERPEASNMWSGSYFMAGKDSYQPYNVRLYVW